MLRLNRASRRLCDGFTRREILELGGLSAIGLSLPQLLKARQARADELPASTKAQPAATPSGFGRAQACILIYLFGGPSQIDLFDLKPDAPDDFRGEFRPIATNVSGISLCEHLPLLAQQADKLTLLRSMHHEHPRHGYGLYYMFTGQPHARPDLDAAPAPHDHPSLGALVSRLSTARRGFPPAVTLPRWNRFLDLPNDYAGETAGFLGRSFDPWLVKSETQDGTFQVSGIELPNGATLDRIASRRDLLSSLDQRIARLAESELAQQHDSLYEQAFALVTSPEARRAFALDAEPPTLRDRYGREPFGQGLLLSRRLVEAGARLVTINWHNDGSDVKSPFWDTHQDNFKSLKDRLVPPLDRGLSALLQDLADRGLLETTLVVVMGEFGRTPKVGRVVMNAATNATGRDHWPHAYTVLLAGGGIGGGRVYGATDERAAYVTDNPVTPPDLVATILSCLGCDLSQRIYDQQGRPHEITSGTPVVGLLA